MRVVRHFARPHAFCWMHVKGRLEARKGYVQKAHPCREMWPRFVQKLRPCQGGGAVSAQKAHPCRKNCLFMPTRMRFLNATQPSGIDKDAVFEHERCAVSTRRPFLNASEFESRIGRVCLAGGGGGRAGCGARRGRWPSWARSLAGVVAELGGGRAGCGARRGGQWSSWAGMFNEGVVAELGVVVCAQRRTMGVDVSAL